jgi:hypothetical protein
MKVEKRKDCGASNPAAKAKPNMNMGGYMKIKKDTKPGFSYGGMAKKKKKK